MEEEFIPKGKVLKNQSGWVEYYYNKKGVISKIVIFNRENYMTIKIKLNKTISIKIQYLTEKIVFSKALSRAGEFSEKIRNSEIFYVDFLETYIIENGFSEFIKYVMSNVKEWINDIFYPF